MSPLKRGDEDGFDEYLATIRRYVLKELDPAADEVETSNQIPERIAQSMASLGLYGLTIPPEYGGQGLSISQFCRVGLELARTHQAYRTAININNGIGSHAILHHGTEQQKSTCLPDIATGKCIVAFALSEPHAGSDVRQIRTVASQQGDGWEINGTKQWITNGPTADLFIVIARDESLGPNEFTAFAVDGASPGIARGAPDGKMGFAGSHTCQIFFDGVVAGSEALLGERGAGFKIAMSSVNTGRLAVSAGAIGAARRALELSVQHARTRVAFSEPIAEKQAVQHHLANMALDVEAAETLLLSVADLADANSATAGQVAMAKLFASEAACRVADLAVQIHGALGYIKPSPVERIYRDVRLFRIVEGTSEIQRNLIAKEVLRHIE